MILQGERGRLAGEVEQVLEGATQAQIRLGQPDGVDVRAHEVLVGQIQPRWRDRSRDHRVLMAEEVLIVRAARGAIREDQCGLPAPARPAAALRVIGGRGRHVAQVDHVELGDVHAQLHRGRAIEDGQTSLAELALALLAQLVGHLGGVLARLHAAQVGGDSTVELHEERIRGGGLRRWVGNADGIAEGLTPRASSPAQGRGRYLIARHIFRARRGRDHLHQARDPQPRQQVHDDPGGVRDG